jgi:hypothetical protein
MVASRALGLEAALDLLRREVELAAGDVQPHDRAERPGPVLDPVEELRGLLDPALEQAQLGEVDERRHPV